MDKTRLIHEAPVKIIKDKNRIAAFNQQLQATENYAEKEYGDPNKRIYFETPVFQTAVPNQQGYRWAAESVPIVAAQFKLGVPVYVMHDPMKLFKPNGAGLPFGYAVDAEGTDDELVAQFYIRIGMTTPNGPYGNTDELVDAVFDGMAASVSPAGLPKKLGCNIGSHLYMSAECGHIRGETYLIENAAGIREEVMCIPEILDFDLHELSIVGLGADRYARVQQQIRLSAAMGSAIDEEKKIRLQKAEKQPEEVNEMTEQELRKREQELNERERSLIDAENEKLKAELEAKNKEIATFSAQQAENERAIKDGKIARANAIALNAEAFSKTKPDTKKAELEKQLEERALGFGIASIEEIEANTKLLVQQVTGKYNDENTDGQSALRKALEGADKGDGNDIDEFLLPKV